MKKVKRTERGWAGHYVLSRRCRFRRNTLLECRGTEIVVSTVGLLEKRDEDGFEEVGVGRYFETAAFHTDKEDNRWKDADVCKGVSFDSPCSISEVDADDKANEMHEIVVSEITKKLEKGYKFE